MVNAKSYQPEKLFILKNLGTFLAHNLATPFVHYLPTVNVKNYQPEKLISFRIFLEYF
jgi:hypothetical protein